MLLIRLLHAIFSVLTVWYGYKITRKISDDATAKTTALMLAFYWFFPFLSVRNLIEMACIPFIMTGMWQLLSAEEA